MNKVVTIAAIAMAFVSMNANALTLKKGEVLTSDGQVMNAHETETGQRTLERDGVLVSAGNVYIQGEESVTTVAISEVAGKSRDRIREIIGEAVVRDSLEGADIDVGEIDAVIEAYQSSNPEALNELLNSTALSEETFEALGGIDQVVQDAYDQANGHLGADHDLFAELYEQQEALLADGFLSPDEMAEFDRLEDAKNCALNGC